MAIKDEADLERAVQEFQTLRHAPDDSADGQRRAALDADIKAFYVANAESLRKAKPEC